MSAEGSLGPEKFQEDLKEALKTFDVIQSDNMSLLVDLDTPEAQLQFDRVLPKVRENFGVAQVFGWRSKSGNWHVLIMLKDALNVSTRIALQAALGSDGVREALALKRLQNGVAEPSVLFRPKGATVYRDDELIVEAL